MYSVHVHFVIVSPAYSLKLSLSSPVYQVSCFTLYMWTRAKRHTADSCFELVGSHQFTLGFTWVYIIYPRFSQVKVHVVSLYSTYSAELPW